MNPATRSLIDEVVDLLKHSVSDVFNTMFNLSAVPAPAADLRAPGQMLVAGSIGFIGDVNGIVYVYLRASFARALACRMLGMDDAELGGAELVNDVIGELTNMIVGSVKSRLCDSGSQCVLTIPSIVRGENLTAQPGCASQSRLLGIHCGAEPIVISVLMKQPA